LSNWGNLPNIVDCTPWSKLEHLDLSNTQLRRLPKLPNTLKFLNLSHNFLLHVGPDDEAPAELPLLETFNCEGTSISSDVLKALTTRSVTNRKLKSLLIGARLANPDSGPAEDEYPVSEDLEELSINLMQINDARVLQIIELYPKLRKLDVSGTRVTGVAVRKFVESGITYLKLDECVDVGTDAVDWARGKGVKVDFNFNSGKSSWAGSFTPRYG
jgi:F-box/TPR repeat protein Pof3